MKMEAAQSASWYQRLVSTLAPLRGTVPQGVDVYSLVPTHPKTHFRLLAVLSCSLTRSL